MDKTKIIEFAKKAAPMVMKTIESIGGVNIEIDLEINKPKRRKDINKDDDNNVVIVMNDEIVEEKLYERSDMLYRLSFD